MQEWAAELSEQKPFESWKNAVAEIGALGPGTHSWLAILKASGQTVGYMVIHASEDGTYMLGEYGAGPDVLFSEGAMLRTLEENGIIESENDLAKIKRHYFHPFAAIWEVSDGKATCWIDAKTNEILPFDSEIWSLLLPSLLALVHPYPDEPGNNSDSIFLRGAFDAYESLPWLTGEKPYSFANAKKAQHRIRGGLRLRYVTEPYGEAALYALPVIGYHKWKDGRLDLALDMAGTRFIPLELLQRFGIFYE